MYVAPNCKTSHIISHTLYQTRKLWIYVAQDYKTINLSKQANPTHPYMLENSPMSIVRSLFQYNVVCILFNVRCGIMARSRRIHFDYAYFPPKQVHKLVCHIVLQCSTIGSILLCLPPFQVKHILPQNFLSIKIQNMHSELQPSLIEFFYIRIINQLHILCGYVSL